MSLRDFLEEMDRRKELLKVNDEVLTKFEISPLMKHFDVDGPVLLFENVAGYETKVVANVCGTKRRICLALKVPEERLYQMLLWAWRSPRKPRVKDDGPVKEVREKTVDLTRIPVLTHFEGDAGPYITSAVVHAKSIKTSLENLSIHRLQVLDEKHLAIRLVPRHLYRLWTEAKEKQKDLDVAVSIGVHPAVSLAAASPVPFGVNEFDVANALLRGKLNLIKCRKVDACAPAEAELVLEGRLLTNEDVVEGPFVDVTGTYDVQRKQPVVEIVGVTHRRNYMYQALLPAGSEHRLLMGLPHEALIWENVSRIVPKVHSVNLSAGGSGWLHAVFSIDKQVDGDAKNALLAAFSAHASLKHAVVVDPDIDVSDPTAVEWAIATRFQSSEDLLLIKNVRGSTLDSSADQETGLTSKMGIDATAPLNKPRKKFERAKITVSKHAAAIIHELKKM